MSGGWGGGGVPKYAVHGRGATKPPAPESPSTASLKPMLVLCLATILLMSGGDLRPPSPVICNNHEL